MHLTETSLSLPSADGRSYICCPYSSVTSSQSLTVLHKVQGSYSLSAQMKNCKTEAEILEWLGHADTPALVKFYVKADCLSSQKISVMELKTESLRNLNPELSALSQPV